jgi:protein TonB
MRPWRRAVPFLLSTALHGLLLGVILSSPARPGRHPGAVEVQILESRRPSPPAQAPAPVPEPRPAMQHRRPALAPVKDAPPPRDPPAPPPPHVPAPTGAAQGPVRIGVSMSSTTEAAGVATTVGNTLYGRVPHRAPQGSPSRPYRSDRYAAPTDVTTLPEPIATEVPKSEYPEEAKRLGIQGAVRLLLLVDEEGRVRRASILADPGHGLGPAAARVAQRYFRFRPARRAGEAVETEIPFTVHFELS